MRPRLAEIIKIRLLAANALCQGLIMFKQSGHRTGLLVRIALIVFGISQHSPILPAQTNGAVSKWETEIAAFETSDKTNPPPKDAILFVGSSSIRLWKTLAQDFPGHSVINRGFGGSQLADSIAFADRIVIPNRPKMVLVYAGDNDIAAGKTSEQVLADFKAFAGKVQTALPETRIAFISIKPSLGRWQLVDKMKIANRLIADYARQKKNLMFIDVFTPMLGPDGEPRKELFVADGLHLNAKGYDLWTSIIAPHLDRK